MRYLELPQAARTKGRDVEWTFLQSVAVSLRNRGLFVCCPPGEELPFSAICFCSTNRKTVALFFFLLRETKTTPIFLSAILSACIYAVSPGLDVTVLLRGAVVGQSIYLNVLLVYCGVCPCSIRKEYRMLFRMLNCCNISLLPVILPLKWNISMSVEGDGLCGTCFRLKPTASCFVI